MIVIRRMIDRQRSYTAIFLPGEPPRIFPTSDYEHARILEIYLQDRPHAGVFNDFAAFGFGPTEAGARSEKTKSPPQIHCDGR